MPAPLVVDIRGSVGAQGPAGDAAAVGTLDGGLFLSTIASIPAGKGDTSRAGEIYPSNMAGRFRGQVFVQSHYNVVNGGTVNVFDEGGTNAFAHLTAAPTAKGAVGSGEFLTVIAGSSFGGIHTIVTENQDYLVGVSQQVGSGDYYFQRYDPDSGPNGAWSNFLAADPSGTIGSVICFVHDGLLHVRPCGQNAGQAAGAIVSYDPVTNSTITYANPSAGARNGGAFFVLYDRLFFENVVRANVATFQSFVEEFTLGAWSVAVTVPAGHGTQSVGNGANLACWQISPDLVLSIGAGGGVATPLTGLTCVSFETAGNSPTGALQATFRNGILPSAFVQPGPAPNPADYRCYGYTNTSDVGGTKRHYLYFATDGAGTVTPFTLFEVFDELTPIVALGAVSGADTDFAMPTNFYGGGERENGLDGSTRLVTCTPRGWSSDTTGLRVRVGAHGDGTVLAYNNKLLAAFASGQTITGGTSGTTATIAGDGAAEGLYVRDVVGAGFAAGETITASGGGTADLNAVLLHGSVTGGPFQVGEAVTSSGTGVGTVTHLGLGGLGETLVKVVVSAGVFLATETITGGTSGATAVLSSGELGSHGGAANKTIRARYYFSAVGPSGKGIPFTGFVTMVAGSGFKGTVSKGSGPGGSDELTGVVADGGVGGDTPASFEWDFLADGVPKFLVSTLAFEIDRV